MTTVAQSPTATQTPVAAIAHVRKDDDGTVIRLEAPVATIKLDPRVRRTIHVTSTGRKVAMFVAFGRSYRSYAAALRVVRGG